MLTDIYVYDIKLMSNVLFIYLSCIYRHKYQSYALFVINTLTINPLLDIDFADWARYTTLSLIITSALCFNTHFLYMPQRGLVISTSKDLDTGIT